MANSTDKFHYQFIHNVFGNFVHDTSDYFTAHLYPRFEYKVVGTYDKAVEYILKDSELNREMDKPNLPAFILNPSGELGVSDANAGGKQLWRFPNLAPGLIYRMFDPIYQDSHVQITPGFTRLKGEFELILLLNSFYEYCDLRILLIQIFGGTGDRFIHPVSFNSFIILDSELVNYEYENDVTGTSYTLNWTEAGAVDRLIETTNVNEKVFPAVIKPLYKMTSLGDGSAKYGGTDKLAEWRITATLEYEVEIPTFLLIQTDYLAERINMNINFSSCYSAYSNYQPPVNRELSAFSWSSGLDSTSNSVLDMDSTSNILYNLSTIFKTRYYHVLTQEQAESETDVQITIPETITDNNLLYVNSKYGKMDYGDHYTIINSGNTLNLIMENITLNANDIIELYVYEYI